MTSAALLIAHHDAEDDRSQLMATLPIGGRTVVERQAREALRAGVSRLVVLIERMTPPLATALDRLRRDGLPLDVARSGGEVSELLAGLDDVLLFSDGAVLDARAIVLVAHAPDSPTILVEAPENSGERIDATARWGGIAKLPAATVRHLAGRLGEWDMQSTLLRAAIQAGAVRLAAEAIPLYLSDRRRDVPLLKHHVRARIDANAATDEILAAAQKGCLDWPARFIHPPIENAMVRLLLNTRVSPNQVTAISGVIGLIAILCFAYGWPLIGLLLVLVVGPLDGVDGKLARTRMQFSRWGDLEHALDKIIEYGVLLALGGWLASQLGHYGPWLLAGIAIVFAFAEAVQGEVYRRMTGHQLDDAGVFERRWRIIGGRRNTFFWSLLPFGIFGAWHAGLAMIALYSVITLVVAQWRFYYRLGLFMRENSSVVSANMTASAYTFLARPKRSAR